MYEQKIIITKEEHGYSVEWGDVKQDHLTWDEMLGQVACLTLTGKSFFAVKIGFNGERKHEQA
jgi:hypothetical protein